VEQKIAPGSAGRNGSVAECQDSDLYSLQRAIFLGLRDDETARVLGKQQVLSGDHRTALAAVDLRRLVDYGVHPVLINALARKAGIRRDDYRLVLDGTGPAVMAGRPRWRG
jgi:hypothetical protein